VTLNDRCKTAGYNKSEPELASIYEIALADRIVCPGRLQRDRDIMVKRNIFRCRGVRGCTLGLFYVVGRETLCGPIGHGKRHGIRQNRSLCRPHKGSAGSIVPLLSLGKPRERKGTLL